MTGTIERDAYVLNYERIASDHMHAGGMEGNNPWQPAACVIANTSFTAGVIRKFVPQGGRLLDIGCGPGDLLATMPEYQRVGVDISQVYLDMAAREGIAVELARAESLPFPDDEFDGVACCDVLEHVLDLHATVSEALRVLKPGGHFVVRVPKEDDLSPYLTSEYDFVHLRRFDEPTLQLLFGRIFLTTVMLLFEYSIKSEGTLANEILLAVRKPS